MKNRTFSVVYGYVDKQTNDVVYVGVDTLWKPDFATRHKEHTKPKKKEEQLINTMLQDEPERYKYVILAKEIGHGLMDKATQKKFAHALETAAIEFIEPDTNKYKKTEREKK